MEEIAILKQMLPHGIAVVAVIILVRYFLSAFRTESERNQLERSSRDQLFVDAIAARDKLFMDSVSQIHEENLEARTAQRESLNANTQATNSMSEKLAANTLATGRVAEKLEALIAVGK